MPNSANPAFVTLDYHSAFGAHAAELPVKELDIDAGDPALTTIAVWSGGVISWQTMVSTLVAQLATRYPATVIFDRATLWLQLLATDLPTFVDSFALGIDGTASTPGYTKAVQETITARDTAGYLAKIVSLDMASGNNFDKQLDPTVAGVDNILDVWFDPDMGWSSRAGFRPSVFIKATRTLNEKLRREYGET